MSTTAMARYLARRVPSVCRMILGLSAQRYLPRAIYDHWLSRQIASDLFPGGMRLYGGPYRLYVPLELLSDYERFEPLTQKYFVRSLVLGMTVIDVGANVGYYTLLAGRAVGPMGRVHAIEPCAANLAYLERNVRLSGLRTIKIHKCAAGDRNGRRTLRITESALDHGFYVHPIAKTIGTVEVEERRLDELVGARVDVVKVDVEGAEIEVLDGMRGILAQKRELSLFVEWSPWCMKEAAREAVELPRYLEKAGFGDIQVLDDLGGRVRSVSDVLQMLQGREPANVWYGTLWARR